METFVFWLKYERDEATTDYLSSHLPKHPLAMPSSLAVCQSHFSAGYNYHRPHVCTYRHSNSDSTLKKGDPNPTDVGELRD